MPDSVGTNSRASQRGALLGRIAERFDRAGIRWWIENGTLLGAMREGRHLEDHPCIDVGVDSRDRDRLESLGNELGPRFSFATLYNRSGRRWVEGEVIGYEITDRLSVLRGSASRAEIAIKFPGPGGRHRWIDFRNCKWADSSYYEHLTRVEIAGCRVPAPGSTERYLALRYGDWRTTRTDWIAEIEDGAIVPDDVIREVESYKRPKRNPRNRSKVALEGVHLERLVAMLFHVLDVLERHEIPYWLEDGTLLGIIRDGDLIPWDHDADISIPGRYAEQVARLRSKLLPRHIMIPNRVTHRWLPQPIRSLEVHHPLAVIQRVNLHVDVLAKYRMDDCYRWIDSKALKHLEPHWYDRLESVEWRGRTLPIPSDPEDYLELRYPNWRVPVKEIDTSLQDPTIAEKGF